MAVRKIAISVPQEVLRDVDKLAKKTGTTRSGFITQVLCDVSQARNRAEITSRINELFEDPEMAEEQLESSKLFLRASDPGFEDPEW